MEIKIAVTTIPFIFAPTQTITIGAKAVFGSAFYTTKNGSNTLESRGDAQSNIATITPPTVPIINPSTVSYTDVLTCTHN